MHLCWFINKDQQNKQLFGNEILCRFIAVVVSRSWHQLPQAVAGLRRSDFDAGCNFNFHHTNNPSYFCYVLILAL